MAICGACSELSDMDFNLELIILKFQSRRGTRLATAKAVTNCPTTRSWFEGVKPTHNGNHNNNEYLDNKHKEMARICKPNFSENKAKTKNI